MSKILLLVLLSAGPFAEAIIAQSGQPSVVGVRSARAMYNQTGMDGLLVGEGDILHVYILHPGEFFRVIVKLSDGTERRKVVERGSARILSTALLIPTDPSIRVVDLYAEAMMVTGRINGTVNVQ